MEEEIATLKRDRMKPYYSINTVSEALPALGIVAAVLGIVKALGAIDQSPAILGGLIAFSTSRNLRRHLYLLCFPVSVSEQSEVDSRQADPRLCHRQTGSHRLHEWRLPQIAVEHGRKGISVEYRPTIDEVETATTTGGRSEELKEAA